MRKQTGENRREFLKLTAATTAGVATGSLALSRTPMPPGAPMLAGVTCFASA